MLARQAVFSTTIPASLAEVRSLRKELEAFATREALPVKLVQDLELSLAELCNNIIIHGYRNEIEVSNSQDTISLKIQTEPKYVEVVISDTAPAFSLPTTFESMPAEPRIHGYGLIIVERLTTKFEVKNSVQGNTWILRFDVPE